MKIITAENPSLYNNKTLDYFLSFPLDSSNAVSSSLKILKKKTFSRGELFTLLSSYNHEISNDAAAFENLEKIKAANSVFVITGQQLGLMGGPSYTILKAMTCLLLARETNAIPLFWLATEDHDTAEIDHTFNIDPLGNIYKTHLSFPKDGHMVEDLVINSSQAEILTTLFENWKIHWPAIVPGISYSKIMATYLANLFAGTGLLFLEPRILRRLAIPFFIKEIIESSTINRTLQETTEKLIASGGQPSLNVKEGTNLFYKDDFRIRRKIIFRENHFVIGTKKLTQEAILEQIQTFPERFSTNAAARPVLQSMLFPTLAYVAGPGEINYFQQLKDYHLIHNVEMPWVVPRLSATIIPAFASSLLEKCNLNPWDNLSRHWDSVIPGLDDGMDTMMKGWQATAMTHFQNDLTEHVINSYVRNGVKKLQNKVRKVRLKRKKLPYFALHLLRNLIHPHNKLQERVLNWSSMQSHTSENMIQEFLRQADWRMKGHLWCSLT
jgi:bacillithiol synthase